MSIKSTDKWKEGYKFKPGRKPLTLEQRFWEKVDKRGNDECWPWLGNAKKTQGYGEIKVNGKVKMAHRICYELEHGVIPDGLVIMHKCDNPGCCNPAHLVLGTVNDNNQDKKQKGRAASMPGEGNPFAKLTEDKVREIRKIREDTGLPFRKIARQFGISQKQVINIVKRRQWGWLE